METNEADAMEVEGAEEEEMMEGEVALQVQGRGDYFVIFCADPGAEIQGFRADMFSPGRSAAALRCLRCLAGPSWPGGAPRPAGRTRAPRPARRLARHVL